MSTHTAIATTAKGQLNAIQVPTESPAEGEVLLKVEYAAMIPFDGYVTDRGYAVQEYPMVLGFGAAGTVEKVGTGVEDLKVGDRVTAFAYGNSRNKAMQEYVVEPRTVCAKIPGSVSLETASTIPDNFVTAFYTLFNQLSLPIPSSFPAKQPPPLANTPILIYGAGSTAGIYAVQLLHIAGYKKIIVTASSRNHEYLRSLGATHAFDYNSSSLSKDILSAAGGEKLLLVVDCIAAKPTLENIAKVISPLGTLAVLLPIKEGSNVTGNIEEEMHFSIPDSMNPFPKELKIVGVRTFLYHEDENLKQNLMPKILPQLLAVGAIEPNRVRLMDKGSFKERVAAGLDLLRNNKVSGEKVVVKVNP
ncbi:chaperonin 10-like protein [Crucibulum laeve]|uniref:Chaperonin 10-like protein n=1 Tax=Crucibulum laeve TaxID=68775 RepID=A0A5C3MC74_9AGAR|nr:chaperonin 10-like protein [Crucibulum laeve]